MAESKAERAMDHKRSNAPVVATAVSKRVRSEQDTSSSSGAAATTAAAAEEKEGKPSGEKKAKAGTKTVVMVSESIVENFDKKIGKSDWAILFWAWTIGRDKPRGREIWKVWRRRLQRMRNRLATGLEHTDTPSKWRAMTKLFQAHAVINFGMKKGGEDDTPSCVFSNSNDTLSQFGIVAADKTSYRKDALKDTGGQPIWKSPWTLVVHSFYEPLVTAMPVIMFTDQYARQKHEQVRSKLEKRKGHTDEEALDLQDKASEELYGLYNSVLDYVCALLYGPVMVPRGTSTTATKRTTAAVAARIKAKEFEAAAAAVAKEENGQAEEEEGGEEAGEEDAEEEKEKEPKPVTASSRVTYDDDEE